MTLDKEIKKQIKAHSLEAYPNECCGLVVVNHSSKTLEAFQCKNISENPEHHFTISPPDYLFASRTGTIIACYHSHPKSENGFSELDKQSSEGLELKSILYSVKGDCFSEYPLPAQPSQCPSYIGREFEMGKVDCFSVFRDFFRTELNININDYYRDEKWQDETPLLYDLNYEKEGFIRVHEGPPTPEIKLNKYDCILFKFLKHTEHISIYLDNGLMLHQPRGKYSLVEEYTDSFKRRTSYIIRHKNLI
jgi:proteasome lid subunit RPN8/RPN11